MRFTFDAGGDREIPLILGLMPVLPRHHFNAETFERTTLEPLVGSGPYVIDKVDAGPLHHLSRATRTIGAAICRSTSGRLNFDEMRFDYFRDASALLEAFKIGQIDLRPEEDPAAVGHRLRLPGGHATGASSRRSSTIAPAGRHVGAGLQYAPRRCSRTSACARR